MAPTVTHPTSVTFLDDHIHRPVNVDAAAYYGANESYSRSRTYSHVSVSFLALPTCANNFFFTSNAQSYLHGYNPRRAPAFEEDIHTRSRRMSHDEKPVTPRRFLIDVEETIRVILEQEDTDGDFQISVTDAGPKLMALGTATSNGFKTFDIRVGTLNYEARGECS